MIDKGGFGGAWVLKFPLQVLRMYCGCASYMYKATVQVQLHGQQKDGKRKKGIANFLYRNQQEGVKIILPLKCSHLKGKYCNTTVNYSNRTFIIKIFSKL